MRWGEPAGAQGGARRGSCDVRGMDKMPAPIDLSHLEATYGVAAAVLEDLYARRRAGARDPELVHLLGQHDRGGLNADRAWALVADLPAR
jgi:hypothetical protein